MTQKTKPRGSMAAPGRRSAEPPRMHVSSTWVTVGSVRLTAGEWDLLHSLATNPHLQRATNAALELTRVGQPFSAVSTDMEELISKGLLMIDGSIKEGRALHPTGAALDAVADVAAVDSPPG
ncbi:MAG TPA: hypothetical protein VEZ12_11750 [Herpetosiphonaceae bacterium]|nr:hypothetical protein [Herpetosiphonaceae bacterium]